MIPIEIKNIIKCYVNELKHTEKYDKVVNHLNNLIIYRQHKSSIYGMGENDTFFRVLDRTRNHIDILKRNIIHY